MLADALEHLVRGIVDNPDDVTVTSRSLRRGDLLFERRDLLGERVVLTGELARRVEVGGCRGPRLVGRDDPRQLRVPTVDALRAPRVGVHGGVGELLLDGPVLRDQPGDGLEHDQRMLFSCPWLWPPP